MDQSESDVGRFRHILQLRLKLQMDDILLLVFFLGVILKFICRAWALQQAQSILRNSFEQAFWIFVPII